MLSNVMTVHNFWSFENVFATPKCLHHFSRRLVIYMCFTTNDNGDGGVAWRSQSPQCVYRPQENYPKYDI
jgi:hypothetical protein